MIDIGRKEIEIQCPECRFYNPTFIRQARHRDVIICRGCKRNIRLNDHMNEVREADRQLRKAFEDFEDTLSDFGS
jgi:hypothetical protein